jgi:hypothetical protein
MPNLAVKYISIDHFIISWEAGVEKLKNKNFPSDRQFLVI